MNTNFNRKCLCVTGFSKDVDRHTLKAEFIKFGDIRKLYLDPSGEFARVFYADKQSAETAVRELKNSLLNWQVTFDEYSQNNTRNDRMSYYNDNYEDDEFSENFDYCDIHGHPLTVLQADSGDLYINLRDIKKTGFALFRRDTFNSVLVDVRQIGTEFELHLLSEAKNYILRNRVASIDEDQILKTIERCKNRLLGGVISNNFGTGRSVSQTAKNLTITSNVQHHNSNLPPMALENVHQRPPKALPNNFIPTQVMRGKANTFQNQQPSGRRDNWKHNGIHGSNSGSKMEDSFNTSSSSDTKDSARRSGGSEIGAKFQKSSKEERERLGLVSFEVKGTYDVTVSYKEEKENICWVQDKRYLKELEEVIIKTNEVADSLEPITPSPSQFVIAEYEGMWNRARIYSIDPLVVLFIDYGNKAPVNLVKAMPDSLKAIPRLANRIAIDVDDINQPVKEDMDLKIFVKQKYDKGTYVVHLLGNENQKINRDNSKLREHSLNSSRNVSDVLCEEPPEKPSETPKQKSFCVTPKPPTELHDGDTVMLVDVDDNKFIVRTKECALKCKGITEHIKNLEKQPLANVKVGQLVLASKDGFAGLFRAVVAERDSDLIVTVRYVDFPGEAELSVKSLRNVDDFLAGEPATILVTPEFKPLEDMDDNAAAYVSVICKDRGKCKLILSKDKFDLETSDGLLLSETLKSFKTPKPILVAAPKVSPKEETSTVAPSTSKAEVRSKSAAASDTKVLYDEMDWIKIEPGKHTLMCYWLQDVDDITFLSSTDEVIEYLETITTVIPADQEPYKPELSEMCLVSYKGPEDDEATWYRAVALSEENGEYIINFVDFGNIETTKSENIRRFPSTLKDIPILGIGCSCTGLPQNQQIVDRMKELIPEGTQVEVVVKELNGLKYQIELPEIYRKLKAEKLF